MKSKFKEWYARIDSDLGQLDNWQTVKYRHTLKKAYEAGRKHARAEHRKTGRETLREVE